MIGYTDRATRCSGSRNRIEWSSTPAPSSGYMFWIAPIHTPSMPVRRSPKYFQVSESGPSGSARRLRSRRLVVFAVVVDLAVMVSSLESKPGYAARIMLTTHVVYGFAVRRAALLPSSYPGAAQL